MDNWQEYFNKAVDLIPYRKAGGMYNKIAEEAYRAGFVAGGKDAMTLKPEPPGVGKIFNNDLIEIRELEEKQKQDKNKKLYAIEDSHPAISKSGETVQEVWVSESAPVSKEAWDSLSPKEDQDDLSSIKSQN